MQIKVAGAGAGKTTNLANIISSLSFSEGKNTYCIAFSNSATENISKRVNSTLKYIPKNLKISTIHSFLFSEIIGCIINSLRRYRQYLFHKNTYTGINEYRR